MRIGKLAIFGAFAAVAAIAGYVPQVEAGWGAAFACGAGTNTSKITWDDTVDVPTEGTATVSGGAADAKPAEDPDMTKDLDALAKAKPLFVYYFVPLTKQFMDANYKFSSKFEMGVLGQETIEFLNKNFICKKVELPADADMKVAKNHARIEIWSPTGKKVGVINAENDTLLNKTPFLGFMQVRIAKSEKLVTEEIARVQKLRKEKEEVGKKQAARQGQ